MEPKFYICEVCGNIIEKVIDSGVPVVCCGQKMKELIANTTDAAQEKHVPVYEVKDNRVEVCVGSTPHPMTEEHYIQWIELCTEQGIQRKELKPGEEPKACFTICNGDSVKAVYAYCNLHGLWK